MRYQENEVPGKKSTRKIKYQLNEVPGKKSTRKMR